jgi:hypothetical protein
MVSTTLVRLSIDTFKGLMITNLKITPMIAPTDAKIPHMRDTIVSISIDVLSVRDVVKKHWGYIGLYPQE